MPTDTSLTRSLVFGIHKGGKIGQLCVSHKFCKRTKIRKFVILSNQRFFKIMLTQSIRMKL